MERSRWKLLISEFLKAWRIVIFPKLSKFKAFISTFVSPPKIWHKPSKSEILIYDFSGVEAIEPFLKKYSFSTLAVRGEHINIFALILALSKKNFWNGNAFKAYCDSYIHLVSPKVIITFIDNDSRFYEISNRFPKLKTVFVQNGRRGEVGDVFGYLEKNDRYHVDFMLVSGDAIGKKYSEYITGTVIPIGSLKNNSVQISLAHKPHTVLFISSWSAKTELGEPFIIQPDGTQVSWENFFSTESLILEFLDTWCKSNDMLLRICGRSHTEKTAEKEFYSNLLRKCKWEYIMWNDIYGTYHQIDSAEIVVFIDSTCGYEALSRGKRTAAFTCRNINKSVPSERFGWPAELPEVGIFWTNKADINEFKRIMDYLKDSQDKNWEAIRKSTVNSLMVFDQGNSQLNKLLGELLGNR